MQLTYSKRARGIAGGCPARAAVQAHPLIGNNPEQTAAAESLWVRLPLDLEHVEWQQDDLTNANQAVRVSESPSA